jgi:hypothetical protein
MLTGWKLGSSSTGACGSWLNGTGTHFDVPPSASWIALESSVPSPEVTD